MGVSYQEKANTNHQTNHLNKLPTTIELSEDSQFFPCVLIQHPKAPSCPLSSSCFWLMNWPRYSPLLSIQPWLLLAPARTSGLLRRL